MNSILYKLYLWWHVPSFGLISALRYPYDATISDGDPFEDAREEISNMME